MVRRGFWHRSRAWKVRWVSRLSVLVVSFNVAPLLRRCLASLSEADEIVVVDNASSDGSVQMVAEEFPRVRLIPLPDNRGFSAGVNGAARAATGDLLLLLNPDTEVPAGALARMVAATEARPDASAIGFRQVDGYGVFQLSFGPAPSLTLELIRMVVQRRLDRGDARLAAYIDHVFSKPRRVPWVTGSSMLVRRSAFDATDGFDEGYFLYFEDADFCRRLSRTIGPVWYDPTVTVVHRRGASGEGRRSIVERVYRQSQRRYWNFHGGRARAFLVEHYLRLRERGLRDP